MIRIKYRCTRRLRTRLFLVGSVIFLVACGQRGPLYLPEPEPESATTTDSTSELTSETEDDGEKTSGA
jgi:predicted small lipoprotein YifL